MNVDQFDKKRFGTWLAGAPADPLPQIACAERRELFRIAAQRLIDDNASGRKVDREALQWARGIVAYVKPLGRPLTTGEPEHSRARAFSTGEA